jgi:hypothetical protein
LLRLEAVLRDRTIGHLSFRIDGENRLLIEILDEVPEAKHHDLMRDHKDALSAVVEADRIKCAS